MAVYWAYLCFLPIAVLCFAYLPVRTAILAIMIGGWWALPVARYGPVPPGTAFPWWIVGISLPSDMLITKAWIPPVVAFAGAAFRESISLRRWRPGLVDVPMAAWCMWPLAVGVITPANPPGWIASLYVAGAWGLPWLVGRVWLADEEGRLALLRAIAVSGLLNLPVAIIEGVRPPKLYGLLYGPHPFRTDGIVRYFGYRPIGFLENGNLYGLWTALAAFAALALVRDRDHRRRGWTALAVTNSCMALAAQSVGAILLLLVGLGLLALWRVRAFLPVLAGAGLGVMSILALHLSGIIPVRAIAQTPAGEHLIDVMRAMGRGSFLWRVSQDSKTLGPILAHPIAGTGQWDWWRGFHTRPWGQVLLLIGQFGLVGLALAWGGLAGASVSAMARLRQIRDASARDPALPLALMTLLALADATLNSFFFSPAILAAGAVAASKVRA